MPADRPELYDCTGRTFRPEAPSACPPSTVLSDDTTPEISPRHAEAQVTAQARTLAARLVELGSPGAQQLWDLRRKGRRRRLRPVKGPHKCWPFAGVTPPDGHSLGGRTWNVVLRDDGELRLAASLKKGRLGTPEEFGHPVLPGAGLWLSFGENLERVGREHGIEP